MQKGCSGMAPGRRNLVLAARDLLERATEMQGGGVRGTARVSMAPVPESAQSTCRSIPGP